MTERNIDTSIWGDSWFQELAPPRKLLFIYLWTNPHCSSAGVYEISVKSIAFDTGLPQEDVPALLRGLAPKVEWFEESSLVWVKNFIRYQTRSPKFLIAVAKALSLVGKPEIRAEVIAYNSPLLKGYQIPAGLTRRECVIIRDSFICQYCGGVIEQAADYEMDHVTPLSERGKDNYSNVVASCRACNQLKLGRSPEKAGMKRPDPGNFHASQAKYLLKSNLSVKTRFLALFPEHVSNIDSILDNVDQLPINSTNSPSTVDQPKALSLSLKPKDQTRPDQKKPPPSSPPQVATSALPLAHTSSTFESLDLQDFKARFPTLDLPWELSRCAEWWRSNGKKLKSPRLAFGNWCQKAVKFAPTSSLTPRPAHNSPEEHAAQKAAYHRETERLQVWAQAMREKGQPIPFHVQTRIAAGEKKPETP